MWAKRFDQVLGMMPLGWAGRVSRERILSLRYMSRRFQSPMPNHRFGAEGIVDKRGQSGGGFMFRWEDC
jgi:hypothetical protein